MFQPGRLTVMAYANGFTFWAYRAESLDEAIAPGFFHDAADMLAVGDVIMVTAPDGMQMLHISGAAVRPSQTVTMQ